MRENLVRDHLKEVEQQLARCEAFLNSQRAKIRTLEINGRDAAEAKEKLLEYVSSQSRLAATRERLRTELAQIELYSGMPAE